MAASEADFRTRLQDWLPKLVLAPSFAVVLLFVYGFILITVVLSFTGSKMLPRFTWVGVENEEKLWALPAWHTAIGNIAIFATLFGGTSQPMTVALNNLVQSSTGVKEYYVRFAGAILAALPNLLVYIVAGRYFVRGLMAGSVKG